VGIFAVEIIIIKYSLSTVTKIVTAVASGDRQFAQRAFGTIRFWVGVSHGNRRLRPKETRLCVGEGNHGRRPVGAGLSPALFCGGDFRLQSESGEGG
jgi:hypothetical protein